MIKLEKRDIQHIKDIGRQLFAETQSFEGISAADAQALLIIKALGIYLQGKGVEPNFMVVVDTAKYKKDYEGAVE